jgi:hypothetical protein
MPYLTGCVAVLANQTTNMMIVPRINTRQHIPRSVRPRLPKRYLSIRCMQPIVYSGQQELRQRVQTQGSRHASAIRVQERKRIRR